MSLEIGSSAAGASERWKQVFVAMKCLYSEDAPGPDLGDLPRFLLSLEMVDTGSTKTNQPTFEEKKEKIERDPW